MSLDPHQIIKIVHFKSNIDRHLDKSHNSSISSEDLKTQDKQSSLDLERKYNFDIEEVQIL